MSMSKIIIFFIIILVIFGGVVVYQYAAQQPKTAKVIVKEQTFDAEIAEAPAELQKGLSGRDSLAEDKAMLFIFKDKGLHAFWMKDMKFPIDIIYINDNKIVSIVENAPPPEEGQKPEDLKVYTPKKWDKNRTALFA